MYSYIPVWWVAIYQLHDFTHYSIVSSEVHTSYLYMWSKHTCIMEPTVHISLSKTIKAGLDITQRHALTAQDISFTHQEAAN